MQFYNATTKRAICQKTDRLCDSNDTSFPRLAKTAEANDSNELIAAWILGADGTWQWDDSNYDDLPIGTQTLVESQNNYSFNDKFLEIDQVEIMDSNGKYFIIRPIDEQDRKSTIPLEEIYSDNGRPVFYDKIADDTIAIYPAPDAGVTVTLIKGIKIKFRRTTKAFTAVATTATDETEPGFISSYHQILPYMMAVPYCMKYKKDRVGLYEKRIEELKQGLIDIYARREMDKRKQITNNPIAFR